MIQIANCKSQRAKKLTSAFTLIEMMVVIGIIAIVAGWAIPGLKRVYEDFKINETFDRMDTLLSSFKAYYLIMSEFPSDSKQDKIKIEYVWCVPSSYYDKTITNGTEYAFRIKPYQASAFDIDNWFNQDGRKQFYVSLFGDAKPRTWYNRFLARYPHLKVKMEYSDASTCVGFFPGLEDYATESADLRNRFY